jgi:hypothetical protein
MQLLTHLQLLNNLLLHQQQDAMVACLATQLHLIVQLMAQPPLLAVHLPVLLAVLLLPPALEVAVNQYIFIPAARFFNERS